MTEKSRITQRMMNRAMLNIGLTDKIPNTGIMERDIVMAMDNTCSKTRKDTLIK